jgi:hypothetical protein
VNITQEELVGLASELALKNIVLERRVTALADELSRRDEAEADVLED